MKTKNIHLSQILQNQASKELIINENNFIIDSLITCKAIDFIDSLPLNSIDGDVYIISNNPDITLTDSKGKIVVFNANFGYKFINPSENSLFFITNLKKQYIYQNNLWTKIESSSNEAYIDDLASSSNIKTYSVDKLNQTFLKNSELSKVAKSGSYNDLLNKPDLSLKVDKILGKSLSENDFTSNYKLKLDNIQSGANVNVQPNWLQSDSTKDDFIQNKPIIPSSQVNSDWNATTGVSQILNKPTLFNGDYNNLINKPIIPQTSDLSTVGADKIWSIDKIISYISNAVAFNQPSNSVGDYKISAKNTNHGNWLLCNGQAVSRLTYAGLFSLIGTSFGAGDGSTTFNLPDARGRVLGMVGQGTGLTNRTIGQVIGTETHTLTVNEMPSHYHNQSTGYSASPGFYGQDSKGVNAFFHQSDGLTINSDRTSTTGNAQSHNNMQPTLFSGNLFICS